VLEIVKDTSFVDNTADIQLVEQTSVSAEDPHMILMAKLAAQVLSKSYPNHWWIVGFAPGFTMIIKYGGADQRFGFTVDAAKAATISEFEKAVVYGGGELLERLGIPRGAWDGESGFGAVYDGAEEHGPNKVH
jgi:hypothetical protein